MPQLLLFAFGLVLLAIAWRCARNYRRWERYFRPDAYTAESSDAIFSHTVDGTITSWNRGAERVYGYQASEIIGQPLSVLIPADWNDRSLQAMQRLQAGETIPFADCVGVSKGGERLDLSLSSSPIRDAGGRVVAIGGIARDITARRRSERQLREAKEAAEGASRLKSAFLANMSHEIRTPMNGILGMVDLLLNGDLGPRQRGRAETVRDSAEGLLSVLNDVLDLSKGDAGKLNLEDAMFDLRKLVEGVADMMAVKSQEKGVELLCFIESAVPAELRGDAGRLRQVLVNLCGNAVKFTVAGEVSIRVKLAGAADSAAICFEVKDSGIGIPADRHHLLFQPFSQANSSIGQRFGGSGLGLSIVRMLVESMRGEVGFHSEEGQGSLFWFSIPAGRACVTDQPNTLSLAGRHILVIDRNAASRDLLMELLGIWDAGAASFGCVQDALNQLTRASDRPVDIILADLDTLQSDGRHFIELPALARTALVLLTPLKQSTEPERWPEMDFAASVSKPVKQGELRACLASILCSGPDAIRPYLEPTPPRAMREARTGWRLLVVEDNRVNQEVALGMLENLGHRVDVVADGEEALEVLGHEDYDLVLMDCHLPHMDGYETSRRIRQSGSAVRNHTIPIIAATASAMPGDREHCIAAGMNDYLAKPLRLDLLDRAIEGCMRGQAPKAQAAAPPSGKTTVTFDSQDFDERLMGNQELARRILRGFVDDMPRQLALLAQAVSDGDANQARLMAHSIKGAAASVSGLEIRENSYKVEQRAREGDLPGVAAALPELAESFERARPVMERFCDGDPDLTY